MNIHNISTISRYETKLLRRSWLFRIFAILSLLVIVFFHMGTQSNLGWFEWVMVAMPSSIPFVNIYLFNIAQSVIAIFLAGSFLKRDKKLDTAEVIYVRPMSNADYIIGKTWGIMKVFVSLNMIALLIAGFIHLFASASPFALFPYFFYLLTLSIPSLIFVLGLSFVIMSFIRNQAVTFVIMLGFIGVTLSYLGDAEHGTFDFFALTVPNMFSDVLGHTNLFPYLVQRVTFLFLGMGLLTFTIAMVNRLPLLPKKNILLNALGSMILIIGISCGFIYFNRFNQIDNQRKLYSERYKKYNNIDKVHLIDQEIVFSQNDKKISVNSHIKIQNRNHQEVDKIMFYLNPSLQIEKLTRQGEDIPYKRDAQIIIVEHKLRPYESLELDITYNGSIDENICYLDITDEEYYDPQTGSSILRFGKRYAFVQDKFTLLTPECLWYPSTFPPVNPEAPYNIRKNFSNYTLKVIHSNERTILSQGQPSQSGDTTIFRNKEQLPGISLAIGDYEKKSILVDSVQIELYNFKGHDFYSEVFPNISDTLSGFLQDVKSEYELRKGRKYPYQKFIMAETPISYTGYVRNWKGNSEQAPPEMVFLPELATTQPSSNFKFAKERIADWGRNDPRGGGMEEIDVEMNVIRDFARRVLLSEETFQEDGNTFVNMFSGEWSGTSKLNKYDLSSMYFNYAGSIYSQNFPIIDIVMNTMLKQEESTQGRHFFRMFNGMGDDQRAAAYLNGKSFEQAVLDNTLSTEVFYEMMKLKGVYLRNYINSRLSSNEFKEFMAEFMKKYQFQEVNFTRLNSEFIRKFHFNLMDFIPNWYTINSTPRFIVKGVDADQVEIGDYTKYIVKFQVYNPTNVEGVISVNVEEGGGMFPGGPRGRRGRAAQMESKPAKNYIIEPRKYKEIRILCDERPSNLTINTNISQNLPSTIMQNFAKVTTTTTDTVTGIFDSNAALFTFNPKEITVDNEDPGFRIIESNQKNKLQSFFKKESEDKYKNLNFWMPPSKWTATIGVNYYGDYINSAVYKKSGSGSNKTEWTTQIQIPGFYEVFVYTSELPMMGWRRRGSEEKKMQYYTVKHDDGEEEISVETGRGRQGWMTLGSFYFSAGEAKITLSDKGSESNQIIFADAVKWVYTNNNK